MRDHHYLRIVHCTTALNQGWQGHRVSLVAGRQKRETPVGLQVAAKKSGSHMDKREGLQLGIEHFKESNPGRHNTNAWIMQVN